MTPESKQGRSLPWFRVDTDILNHPKVDALSEWLEEPLALAYVVRLWAWTMTYAARGRLADGARRSVERACEWRGQSGELWAALVGTGWIDVLPNGEAEVHDWEEHNGAAVAKAEKDAERKRTARGRRGDGAGRSTDGRADGAGTARVTERNETEQKEGPDGPAPQLTLVGEKTKTRAPPKPPDPEAEFKRFAAALTPDEGAVFAAYEAHMGFPLAADWGLKKFVASKLKAHHATELCAAIKGHASDSWRREKSPSLRAILRDATVIGAMAKAAT
jgi:hypothetical protein